MKKEPIELLEVFQEFGLRPGDEIEHVGEEGKAMLMANGWIFHKGKSYRSVLDLQNSIDRKKRQEDQWKYKGIILQVLRDAVRDKREKQLGVKQ